MASVFTQIIQGNIPCEKVFETEHEIAFLDIMPVSSGHTLVVPKREVARLEELTEEEAISLMRTLHRVAIAVSKSQSGIDYNLILNNGPSAGQEVPHVHFHIIPREHFSTTMFSGRHSCQEEELHETGANIRACL